MRMNFKQPLIFLFCLILFARSQTCLTDPGCSLCTQGSLICSTCYDGYVLSSDHTCQYSASMCQQNSGVQCIFSFCLIQRQNYNYWSSYYNYCQTCVQPYSTNNNGCGFYCSSTGTYVSDIRTCKPYCSINNCDLCSYSQSNVCASCSSGYYLFNNECLSSCPQLTYPDYTLNSCLKCNTGCLTCSQKDTCTLCSDQQNSTLPSCKCLSGKVFQDTKCESKCKYNYHPIDQVCQKICSDGTFPVFSQNGANFDCQIVTSSSSDYCFQNVNDLKNLISIGFSLSPDLINYALTVQFEQTSLICFQVELFGINQFSFQQQYIQNFSNYSETAFLMRLSDLQNSNQVYCTYTKCYLYLKISWKGYVVYIFQISLQIQLQGSLISSLTYNSDYQQVDIVCENCIIPSNQVIPSQIQVTCATGQACNSGSITTSTSSSIVITQTISDSTLKKNTVLPHSLKLSYYDRTTGYNVDTYINNYTYVNSVLGQITYTFSAKPVQNAQLTVTSTIKDAIVGNRILSSSSASVKYPQMILSVTIEGDSNSEKGEEEKSNSTIIIIAVAVVCMAVSLSIAGFFGYKLYKKNQLKKISLKIEQGKDVEAPQNIFKEQCDLDQSEAKELKEQKQIQSSRIEQLPIECPYTNKEEQIVRIQDITVDEVNNQSMKEEQNMVESLSQKEGKEKRPQQSENDELKEVNDSKGQNESGRIVIESINEDASNF